MSKKTITIATDFSDTPAGRYVTDGNFSGQRFRDEFLYPALLHYDEVEVNLDGALGYGSSFLEEAFAGLIREKKIDYDELRSKLTITSSRPLYTERIWHYIKEASDL